MTKAELVKRISDKTNVNHDDVLTVVEEFMNSVKVVLARGENIYLRGFGTFELKERKQKVARNISTNTQLVVPAHNIPFFKPCKTFKDAVASM